MMSMWWGSPAVISAQEGFVGDGEAPIALEEVIFPDDHDPSELLPLRDEEWQEIQGSVEDSFYGIISYDIYERAYKVEDVFPLGYSAVVNYEYYPRLYEFERGWEAVVARESGRFMRGEEVIASYEKTFTTDRQLESAERNGFSVMIPIMKAIAAVLGLAVPEEAIP